MDEGPESAGMMGDAGCSSIGMSSSLESFWTGGLVLHTVGKRPGSAGAVDGASCGTIPASLRFESSCSTGSVPDAEDGAGACTCG